MLLLQIPYMSDDNKYTTFIACYNQEDFPCAAAIVYDCLHSSINDELLHHPLYKPHLQSLLAEMHRDGIRFDTSSFFYNMVGKIHGVVIVAGSFNLDDRAN